MTRYAETADTDSLFKALLEWAAAQETNQFVLVDERGAVWVSYGDQDHREAYEVEAGDTVAIGGYRSQWYAFADAHGWTANSAQRFCLLINEIHGLDVSTSLD